MLRIESLLSARLFIAPQLVGDRLYFLSNLSGRLSLYAMDAREGGSTPEPLLPPDIAVQNPHLMNGYAFFVFPKLGKILLMLDHDGDENYQPMAIPLSGGYPEPAFGDRFNNYRAHCLHCDPDRNLVYLNAESRSEAMIEAHQANLETGETLKLGQSKWGAFVAGYNADHTQAILGDGYTIGDIVLYRWTKESGEMKLLYGTPLEQRAEGQTVPLTSFGRCYFVNQDRGLLLTTSLFSDAYGLGYLDLDDPKEVKPVAISGVRHTGLGELTDCHRLKGNRYNVEYNIDGCSWLYEGVFDEVKLEMKLESVICGEGQIANGMLEHVDYEEAGGAYAISYSTATSPTQIYTLKDGAVIRHTRERVLGLPAEWLSPGEDASFTSHDGLRVSARLYLPAPALKFEGQRPLVYYVHGGPQGQERPDFAWFSMPLIQFLALNGFAVFVPNVRGSTGYGLSYTKHVDHDWGGQDRLDHVHAMTKILPNDKRIDVKRAAVVGRSYGGYMTLTLAARHPDLWSAAVDMFGPYDLFTFTDRLPETWKPYFHIAIGHPEKDRDFLIERSPRTHIENIACPLLVIQGKNDPRVVERESRDVVEQLQARGKTVEYLMFEDEGHDVLKYNNRVRCYNGITEFFKKHLRP
jgi:pimeloyl-ACP methyl ester carboxylesterase